MALQTGSGFPKEHLLMPNRVREVLLVSSRYDAFVLEEDGHLTEQVFLEYKSLSLSSAPRFTHVTTEQTALDLHAQRPYDMVLCVTRDANLRQIEFSRALKALRPNVPVVLLGLILYFE